MRLSTNRLYLIPLQLDDLRRGMTDRSQMAAALGCDPELEPIADMMKSIYGIKAENIERDPIHYLFYTYWQMVRNEDWKIIGEVGFKGLGSESELEVGYGTESGFRGRGYMTEALMSLLDWAFAQTQVLVDAVVATTDKSNAASQQVLRKVGMRLDGEDESFYYWRLKKDRRVQ